MALKTTPMHAMSTPPNTQKNVHAFHVDGEKNVPGSIFFPLIFESCYDRSAQVVEPRLRSSLPHPQTDVHPISTAVYINL